MTAAKGVHMFVLAIVAVGVLSGCTGPKKLTGTADTPIGEEFRPSRVEPGELLQYLGDTSLAGVQGRARVLFSAPGSSERGIAEFKADRENMLVSLRNSLGIEGGHVKVDADSVLLYYSLDRIAWKFSIEDYESMPDISLKMPLNLLEMIKPVVLEDDISSIQENASSFLLVLDDGSELVLDRQSRLPSIIRYKTDIPDRFSEFTYEAYSKLNGISLPRRIQAVTHDRSNRIRLDVLDLQVNPPNMQFSLTIPNGVPIFR